MDLSLRNGIQALESFAKFFPYTFPCSLRGSLRKNNALNSISSDDHRGGRLAPLSVGDTDDSLVTNPFSEIGYDFFSIRTTAGATRIAQLVTQREKRDHQ